MRWLPLRRPKTAAVPSGETPKVTPQRSLWNLDSGALLELVALPKPAPGGGSAAIITGCMGTALLRKAFAISRSNSHTVHKTTGDDPIDELSRWDRILRTSANMDATRFDCYIRALMLPRSSPAEKRVREKAVEHAMFRATSIPIDAAATILAVVVLALRELPAVEDVVFSDAVTGIRLLNVSAGCLLYIAEGNLRKISHAAFASVLSEQLEALRNAIVQAESELMHVLDSRASNLSSPR